MRHPLTGFSGLCHVIPSSVIRRQPLSDLIRPVVNVQLAPFLWGFPKCRALLSFHAVGDVESVSWQGVSLHRQRTAVSRMAS